MRPAVPETPVTIATRRDTSAERAGELDHHAHELLVAQLEASAAAAERLDRAYAGLERRLARVDAHDIELAEMEARAAAAADRLERRLARIASSLEAVEGPVPAAAVSRDQLRLVVGG